MPELPEVETIVRSLRPRILRTNISDIQVLLPKIIHTGAGSPADLIGQTLLSIFRRGKNIVMEFSQGWYVRVHLKMTGQLLINFPGDPVKKHTHVIFSLNGGKYEDEVKHEEDAGKPESGKPESGKEPGMLESGRESGKLELRYRDTRQFGYIQILTAREWENWDTGNLVGPDPLEISFPLFLSRLRGRKGKLKAVLLDQAFLGGLGNIYADEILHRAGIHPESSPIRLSDEEVNSLYRQMQSVLKAAIQQKGSSVSDYVEASGERGQYQNQHQVYGRAGLGCRYCGGRIEKIRVAGRGTCFCPRCQRLKK